MNYLSIIKIAYDASQKQDSILNSGNVHTDSQTDSLDLPGLPPEPAPSVQSLIESTPSDITPFVPDNVPLYSVSHPTAKLDTMSMDERAKLRHEVRLNCEADIKMLTELSKKKPLTPEQESRLDKAKASLASVNSDDWADYWQWAKQHPFMTTANVGSRAILKPVTRGFNTAMRYGFYPFISTPLTGELGMAATTYAAATGGAVGATSGLYDVFRGNLNSDSYNDAPVSTHNLLNTPWVQRADETFSTPWTSTHFGLGHGGSQFFEQNAYDRARAIKNTDGSMPSNDIGAPPVIYEGDIPDDYMLHTRDSLGRFNPDKDNLSKFSYRVGEDPEDIASWSSSNMKDWTKQQRAAYDDASAHISALRQFNSELSDAESLAQSCVSQLGTRVPEYSTVGLFRTFHQEYTKLENRKKELQSMLESSNPDQNVSFVLRKKIESIDINIRELEERLSNDIYNYNGQNGIFLLEQLNTEGFPTSTDDIRELENYSYTIFRDYNTKRLDRVKAIKGDTNRELDLWKERAVNIYKDALIVALDYRHRHPMKTTMHDYLQDFGSFVDPVLGQTMEADWTAYLASGFGKANELIPELPNSPIDPKDAKPNIIGTAARGVGAAMGVREWIDNVIANEKNKADKGPGTYTGPLFARRDPASKFYIWGDKGLTDILTSLATTPDDAWRVRRTGDSGEIVRGLTRQQQALLSLYHHFAVPPGALKSRAHKSTNSHMRYINDIVPEVASEIMSTPHFKDWYNKNRQSNSIISDADSYRNARILERYLMYVDELMRTPQAQSFPKELPPSAVPVSDFFMGFPF